ncbi:MAG: DUF4091 domain-containing protein, partial [Armatimonadetes bacterium]|nr:DUF4091 domain-containing protein [Armatimonadota bacterium]
FTLPPRVKRLVCQVGASALGGSSGAIRGVFQSDGKTLAEVGPLSAGQSPQRVELDVAGRKKLRIEATAAQQPGVVAVVADPLLLKAEDRPPAPFARQANPEELRLQRMRAEIGKVKFQLPKTDKGYVVYAAHPLDLFDLEHEPVGARWPKSLELSAAPGEWEGGELALCAAVDLPRVSVTASALEGPAGTLPQDVVELRLVRRVLQRRGYWMKRKPENYEALPRFLFPNRPFWLPAGHIKEIYVLVHVPDTAAPGTYEGKLTVRAEGRPETSVVLRLHVWPIKLLEASKHYGMYYNVPEAARRPAVMHAELADMAAHGCTMLVTYAGITFERAEPQGKLTWNYDQIRLVLDALKQHGFHGPIVVSDSIFQLARVLHVRGVVGQDASDALAKHPELVAAMDAALQGLKRVAAEYPQFELVLTHMDEVFNRGRMPRFLDAVKIVRRTPGFRFFETMHMMPGRWEEYMKQCNEYVDVRCLNGHSIDEWLKAGHTFADLAALLKASGDEGWVYYNMRGSFFRPEWNRIVNGLYLWASPLTTHAPWMYNAYGGDPFDDTDAARYDFGYAFPSPDDPRRPISTLHWEAFREGCDDARYLTTLQALDKKAQARGVRAATAESWLREFAAKMPALPDDIADINLESPVLVFLANKYSGADWDATRRRTAQEILALQRKLGQ